MEQPKFEGDKNESFNGYKKRLDEIFSGFPNKGVKEAILGLDAEHIRAITDRMHEGRRIPTYGELYELADKMAREKFGDEYLDGYNKEASSPLERLLIVWAVFRENGLKDLDPLISVAETKFTLNQFIKSRIDGEEEAWSEADIEEKFKPVQLKNKE